MRLVWGGDEAVSELICAVSGVERRDFGPGRALAVLDGDELVGGAIVHDWNPEAGTVEISAGYTRAGVPHRWVTRALAGYTFGTMQCQAIIFRCDESNLRVRRLARSMGGQEHIIPRMRGRAASEAIILIYDDAFRASKWS